MNRKAERAQPSIPRRCTSSRGNLSSISSGSKRCGGLDTLESDVNEERRRKKHKPVSQVTMEAKKSTVQPEPVVSKAVKLTGHSFKSRLKNRLKEASVLGSDPLLSDESTDKGKSHDLATEDNSADKGKSPFLAPEKNSADKGKLPVLAPGDNGADKGKLPVLAPEKNSADKWKSPVLAWGDNSADKRKSSVLAPEDNSADTDKFVSEVQENCAKRMKKLIRKQKAKMQEFHRKWDDKISNLKRDYKLEVAIIRVIHGTYSGKDKLKILDDSFAMKMEEQDSEKDRQLKELEEEQLAAQNEENQKATIWLSQAKDKSSHIRGAKDVKPLTVQHGKDNGSSRTVKGNHVVRSDNSDCATAEEGACDSRNKEVLSKLPETVASGIVDNVNSVSVSTNIPVHSPDADHLGSDKKTSPHISASGERVPGEVQTLEQHEDILLELPETVGSEIVDNANPEDLSTNSPIEVFDEGDAIVLSDAKQLPQPKHFGCAERISADIPASGETVLCGMQMPDLCKDASVELAKTNAQDIVDNVNPVELSADTSIKGFGEGDAIDLPGALLDRRIETDRITIDDLGLAGQVLKTPENTKASQHPYPLLPMQVQLQKDHDVMSAEIQGCSVQVVRLVNSSPSEIVSSELVTARNSLSNTEPHANEEPTIETQCLSRTEGSTLKIIDTVITESSVKLPYQDASVVKDQVTSHIEAAESERIDIASPEIVSSELVAARNSLLNIEPHASEEPAIETQSLSRTEGSTSKIIDAIIAESSVKLPDQDASVVKDQVTSQIEAAETERIDIASPVAASELVLTAKTWESNDKLQDQVEPGIETESTSQIGVSVSENLDNTSSFLSGTAQQEEDALIVTDQVNVETEVSNSGQADNSIPMQCCTDAPPIESDEQLDLMLIDAAHISNQFPAPELESQSHNLGRNSSVAAETEMLSCESTSHLREDLESQINFFDFTPEGQPSLAASVEISASFQNNIATELVPVLPHETVLQLGGATYFRSDQVSRSVLADPLQSELQKIHKDTDELQKNHEDTILGLKSEYMKEMEEVQKKYQLKFQEAQAQHTLKNNGLIQKQKKILMNKLLADALILNSLNETSLWPLQQLDFQSSSMQYHQYSVTPAGVRAPAPHLQTASLNVQPVQQTTSLPQFPPSLPITMRFCPVNSQPFAAPPVQADSHSQAMSRHLGINGVHPMSLPRFGGDIYSSAPQVQASIPAAAPLMPSSTLIPSLPNILQLQRQLQQQQQRQHQHQHQQQLQLQLQQQQQQQLQRPLQQPLAAPQWSSSNSHNPQLLGYQPATTMPTSASVMDILMGVEPHLRPLNLRQQQLHGAVQGNNPSSDPGAADAICLSDDD